MTPLLRETLEQIGDGTGQVLRLPAPVWGAEVTGTVLQAVSGHVRVFWKRGFSICCYLETHAGPGSSSVTCCGQCFTPKHWPDILSGQTKVAEGQGYEADMNEAIRLLRRHFRPGEWEEARALARSMAHLWPASESTFRWLDHGGYEEAEGAAKDAWAHHVLLDRGCVRPLPDIERDGPRDDNERSRVAACTVRFAVDSLMEPRLSAHHLKNVQRWAAVGSRVTG